MTTDRQSHYDWLIYGNDLSSSKVHSCPPHVSPLSKGDIFWERLEPQQRWKVFQLQMALQGGPDAGHSREGGWARRKQPLAHIHCFHHRHSYSQSLPSCCFNRSDLWLRGCNLSSFPLTDGCPKGSHSGPGCQHGSKSQGKILGGTSTLYSD